MKDFNPGAADGRPVGMATIAYTNENRIIEKLLFGSASPRRHTNLDPSRHCVCGAASPTMINSQNGTSGYRLRKPLK
jgi:hypothetical protein